MKRYDKDIKEDKENNSPSALQTSSRVQPSPPSTTGRSAVATGGSERFWSEIQVHQKVLYACICVCICTCIYIYICICICICCHRRIWKVLIWDSSKGAFELMWIIFLRNMDVEWPKKDLSETKTWGKLLMTHGILFDWVISHNMCPNCQSMHLGRRFIWCILASQEFHPLLKLSQPRISSNFRCRPAKDFIQF